MNGSLKVIIGFMKKEFVQALRDPVMRVFIFIAPVIQLAIFGYAINNEFKNLRLSVLFAPPDIMARRLADTIYANGWFENPGYNISAEKLLSSNKADAVLIMPKEGLTKAFGRGNAVMQLLIDAKNANKARAIDRYARAVVLKFYRDNSQSVPAPPLSFDIRILFNPTMETSIFMVPGIMTLIMSLITIILTSMSLAKEKELGTFETIIAAPIAKWEIIVGKAIPFMLIGLTDALIVITAGKILFDVPIRGSVLLLILATLIFIITTVCIGLLISSIAGNQQQAMMGTFMFEFPAILLSGVMFPVENMPEIIKLFAYLNPLMYYVKLIRNIMLKGSNPDLVFWCLLMLVLLTAVVMITTIARFKQKLN